MNDCRIVLSLHAFIKVTRFTQPDTVTTLSDMSPTTLHSDVTSDYRKLTQIQPYWNVGGYVHYTIGNDSFLCPRLFKLCSWYTTRILIYQCGCDVRFRKIMHISQRLSVVCPEQTLPCSVRATREPPVTCYATRLPMCSAYSDAISQVVPSSHNSMYSNMISSKWTNCTKAGIGRRYWEWIL